LGAGGSVRPSTDIAQDSPRFAAVNVATFAHDGPRPDTGVEPSELEKIYWNNTGVIVHKWHHYLPIYERHFGAYCGRAVRMLEIGVSKGGSLDMWRKYFGPDAVIYGIDIDPSCEKFNGISAQVRIGSQDDPTFLRKVVEEMGGVDIILDDGSHINPHINASLDVLFPLLQDGGIYMVEDTHACYWEAYSGGYRIKSSFLERAKNLIDDLHHWYHPYGETDTATKGHLSSMHVYDSIVILEKRAAVPPRHSMVGTV
jgi:hypothetical protein